MSSSTDGQPHRKLALLVGMLGSDYDGERANAAKLATAELKRLGLTWADLISRAFGYRKPEPPPRPNRSRQEEQADFFRHAWARAGGAYSHGFAGGMGAGAAGAGPYQQTYEPKPRTASYTLPSGEKLELWDFIQYANRQRSELSAWDLKFLDTFLGFGPGCSATEAQWQQILRMAQKLEAVD